MKVTFCSYKWTIFVFCTFILYLFSPLLLFFSSKYIMDKITCLEAGMNTYFKSFDNEDKPNEIGNDIDPETHLCSKTQLDCEYYTEEDLKVANHSFY